MKFAVFGTGGVGGFYGAMLARCGSDVTFISRGKKLKAMKDNGLTVKSFKHGTWNIKEGKKIRFTDNPKDICDDDVILVCVKSYDTEKVASVLSSVVKPNAVVISVQNGIENEEILSRYLGSERVLGATAFVGSYVEKPGTVIHEAAGLIEIGEMNGKPSKRVESIVKIMRECGIDARASRDIRYSLWKKLVWNVAFNPYSIVTRSTVGEMLSMRETYDVLKNLMLECYKVAESYGVSLKPKVMENYLKSTSDLMNYKTSMLLDFEREKPIELEGITGALIRKAYAKGIDVPYNKCVYATVKILSRKQLRTS